MAPPQTDVPQQPGVGWSNAPTVPVPQTPPWQAPTGPPPVAPLPPQRGPAVAPVAGSATGRRVALVAGGVVAVASLFGGGFLTGRATVSDQEVLTPTTARAASATTTLPRTNAAPTTTAGSGGGPPRSTTTSGPRSTTSSVPSSTPPPSTPSPSSNVLPLDATKEPIEAVADLVRPAVVQLETNSGLGTGFIYDSAGWVLTAAHVTSGSLSMTVRLADGTRLEGRVVGSDSNTDVSVVKFTPPAAGVATVALAIANPPKVGQTAIAIGSPFGLDQTVTAGIVSSVNRPVPVGRNYIGMIQTDAPINSGNSGGPLVNLKGQVIGINDQIRTETGGNLGIGFAIPIDLAFDVAKALAGGTQPEFGYLGIQTEEPLNGQAGALVTSVSPGSPAELGGIRKGDIVLEADGKPITEFAVLNAVVRSHKPTDLLRLKVRHDDGKEAALTVTLGRR